MECSATSVSKPHVALQAPCVQPSQLAAPTARAPSLCPDACCFVMLAVFDLKSTPVALLLASLLPKPRQVPPCAGTLPAPKLPPPQCITDLGQGVGTLSGSAGGQGGDHRTEPQTWGLGQGLRGPLGPPQPAAASQGRLHLPALRT